MKLWWKQCSKHWKSDFVAEPLLKVSQRFHVGERVRLIGKLNRVRRVLAVEWHKRRHQWVYIVEIDVHSEWAQNIYWYE